LRIVGSSDIGMVRKENQDALWYSEPVSNSCIAVVCDGMGGINGGQIASRISVDTVRDYFADHSISNNLKKQLAAVIQDCNRAVVAKGQSSPEYVGMGTTMVMAIVTSQSVYFANIGDSRGYHITNGNITQVTKDHSAVQELVDHGRLTEHQAKIHPNKNIITRAIGVEETVEFDFFEVKRMEGDVIVLCTDGLTNFVDENEIQFEVAGGELDDLPQRLIDLANSRGGTDNITVVAIQL